MKLRKLTSLGLTSAMLFTASCGGTSTPSDDTTSSDTTTEAVTTANPLADNLPEKDYNGAEFNITINTYCETGYHAEEQTGDVLSDAIYNRNKAVEDRFNVKLNFISEAYSAFTTTIQNSVLAGDDEYQLLAHHNMSANTWVMSEILVNWNEVPHVDFSKPWWSASNTNELQHDGVVLLAVGDFALTTIGRTYAFYYDKVLAANYNLPDMYALVNEGKWTLDKLSELSKDVYDDRNMNGDSDFADMHGFSLGTGSDVGSFMFTSGVKIVEDGKVAINVERMSDLLTKLMTLTRVNEGTFYDLSYKNASGNHQYAGVEKMAEGRTLFATGMIESGINYLRNANDYGIIPHPKFDEAQSDYITVVDGGYSSLAIPKTVQDLEMSGLIAEALCAETRREVIPDYMEVALKLKGARDEESIAMIDFILERRVFDFGFAYDAWKGFGFSLEELVREENENFASYYASKVESVTAHYESVMEIFESYGE